MDFSGDTSGKESACQCRGGFNPWGGGADPLEKRMVTHSSILAEKSHGQRSLVGYSPWGHKESDMTEQLNNNKVMLKT